MVPSSIWVPSSLLINAGLKKIADGLSRCAIVEAPWPKDDAPCVYTAKPEPGASEIVHKMKNKAAKKDIDLFNPFCLTATSLKIRCIIINVSLIFFVSKISRLVYNVN